MAHDLVKKVICLLYAFFAASHLWPNLTQFITPWMKVINHFETRTFFADAIIKEAQHPQFRQIFDKSNQVQFDCSFYQSIFENDLRKKG
jgi:hypothetical protein